MARKTYYQRPVGLYETILVINGKHKAFLGHTLREVEQKMIAYQGEIERGRLFKDVAEEWRTQDFPTLASKTLSGYEPAYRRAVDEFDDVPIKQITALQIKNFLLVFAHSNPGEKTRSQKTINTQRLVVNLILSYATEKGDIEYNPCASVKPPKREAKHKRGAASPEDEKKIKESAYMAYALFPALYGSAPRRGSGPETRRYRLKRTDNYGKARNFLHKERSGDQGNKNKRREKLGLRKTVFA